MTELISKKEDIKFELQALQDFLEIQFQSDNPTAVEIRNNELAVYMARSGKLLADAKYHKNERLASQIFDQLRKLVQLPATTANKYVEALVKEENYLVDWAERLNRTCTHQLDWGRSIISKAKEEMRFQAYGSTTRGGSG